MKLVVACYLWHDADNEHNQEFIYGKGDVTLLKGMVERHLSIPHEFVCITDQPEEFEGTDIRPVELNMSRHIPNAIFAKLFTFSPDFGNAVGSDKVLVLDLDAVVTGSLDEVVSRPEPLVLWRNPTRIPYDNPFGKFARRAYYNLSVVLIEPGAETRPWTMFDPYKAVRRYHTDQDWTSELLGPDVPHWNGGDGIYRTARKDTPGSGIWGDLPDNARIVFFPGGRAKPWRQDVQEANPWIKQHRW